MMDELNDNFKKSAESFSMKPSAGIWENVEADIRRRERKRRFIIFFFFGIALLAGGILFFSKSNTQSNVSLTESKPVERAQNKVESQNNVLPKQSTSIQQSGEANSAVEKRITPTNSLANNSSAPTERKVSEHRTKAKSSKDAIIKQSPISITKNEEPKEIIREEQIVVVDSATNFTTEEIVSSPNNSSVATVVKSDSIPKVEADSTKKDGVATAKKDTTKAYDSEHRWGISLGAGPAFNYSKHEEIGDYQFVSNYRDSSDKNVMTWNYRFAISYRIIPQLEIYTGIGVSNFEQEIQNRQAIVKADTNLVITLPNPVIYYHRGYFNINNDSTGTIRNKVTFLEIPFGIKYSLFTSARFGISLQPEISFGKMIQSSGYAYNSQDTTYRELKNADFRSIQISYGAGISFGYLLSDHFSFEATPFYRKYHNSIFNNDHSVKQNIRQFEIRLSLVYGF